MTSAVILSEHQNKEHVTLLWVPIGIGVWTTHYPVLLSSSRGIIRFKNFKQAIYIHFFYEKRKRNSQNYAQIDDKGCLKITHILMFTNHT